MAFHIFAKLLSDKRSRARPHRLGFGQQRVGVGDERSVRGRPRHPVSVGDLGHRAGRVADRRADLGAQPPGGPRPGRAGTCGIDSVNDPCPQ
jgi:hypothetical protein